MKQLLLLRHAQALPTESGGQDFDRKLSPKGLSDAYALGQTLKAQKIQPDLILCSSSLRTKTTCEELQKGMNANIHTALSKAVYEARAGELLAMIQETKPKVKTLMVIAHNPSIYELAGLLSPDGSDSAMQQLAQGYAPATLSLIEAPIDDWALINPHECRLLRLMDPLDYNAPATPARWT